MCVRCCFFFFLEALLWIINLLQPTPWPRLLLPMLVSIQSCPPTPAPPSINHPTPHHSTMRRVNAWLSQIITSAFHAGVQSDLCADAEVLPAPHVLPERGADWTAASPAVAASGSERRDNCLPSSHSFSGDWMESPVARRAFGPAQAQNSGPRCRVEAAPCQR